MAQSTRSEIKSYRRGLSIIGLALILFTLAPAQSPVGTAFTYQGILTHSGSPANGAFDLQFTLYNAATGGAWLGSTLTKADLAVSNGRFTADLDFGATAFNGDGRWLGIAVRPGASTGAYTPLAPRQALRPAPYALSAQTARSVPWSAVSGAPSIPAYTAGAGLKLSSGQFSILFGNNGASTSAARADHLHDTRYYNQSTADGRFLRQAGPDTLNSTSTKPALSVTQAGTGTGGLFTTEGYTGVYGSTSFALIENLRSPLPPPRERYMAYPAGVLGVARNGGYGVWGRTTSGAGVAGIASSTGNGVEGRARTGWGGYFFSTNGQAVLADGSATVTTNLVVGGALTTPQVKYTTPHTHYLSMPSNAFVPSTNVAYWNIGGAYVYSGSTALCAPVYLPDGATIESVTFVYVDNSPGDLTFILDRRDLQGLNVVYLANTSTTGTPGQSQVTSSINAAYNRVDNFLYTYSVIVSCSNWTGPNVKIQSVRIAYTLPEAP